MGQGPSLQAHIGVTEGNGLQVTGQKILGETEATRFFCITRVEQSDSRERSMHGVQRLRDRLSLTSFAGDPWILAKETIPCRHRGQGMDPGGPCNKEGMLLVEQR